MHEMQEQIETARQNELNPILFHSTANIKLSSSHFFFYTHNNLLSKLLFSLTMSFNYLYIILIFVTILFSSNSVDSQAPTPSSTCNGVFLSYTHTTGYPIPPINSPNQPYRFESTLTILNNGLDELKSWRVFVGFQHEEVLVSATNAVLADGSSLPAFVGNGTVFSGFPKSDLKSAVETAGDLSQMEVQIRLVGTQFGVGAPNVPMPGNISLANDGYRCLIPTFEGNVVLLMLILLIVYSS